jgi:chemotaxis protein MotB
MVLALPAGLLFEPGGADIAAAARPALADLAGMLGNIGNAIAVEGHSDPTIADDGSTRSDRAISIERAIAVAAALRAAGYPREVKTAGFGSSRFAELAGVEPRERRYALARRVDIVVRPYREAP